MTFVVADDIQLPPSTAVFAETQQAILEVARDSLLKAQESMQKYENRGRKEAVFNVGEHVFLSTVNLGNSYFSTTSRKLRPAYCGPFLITAKESDYTYRLALPLPMKALHPVFHAGLLWRAQPTPADMAGRLGAGVELPGPINLHPEEGVGDITTDAAGAPVYVMEKVLSRRKSGNAYEYLIKWKGYGEEEASYITRRNAVTTGAARMLTEFDATQPVATRQSVQSTELPQQRAPRGKRHK